MNDLAHQRPDGGDMHFTGPAPDAPAVAGTGAGPQGSFSAPGDDAFGALVLVLRRMPAHGGGDRPAAAGPAYEAAAAGAMALRARGCEPEAMLVQLKQALLVGALPLSVTGRADELSERIVRHAIAAYYDER